jgi:membrane protease YdiL (CAAX protease family)
LSGDKFRWVAIAALVGVVTGVLLQYLVKITGNSDPWPMLYPFSIPAAVTMFVSQVGLAGVNEEPFFRGILWGYLKQRRMPEIWIWLLQTFLFGLSHIYHLQRRPLYFWVVVPVAGLVMGYVNWRSRSIATSMIVHGFINSIAWLIPYMIQLP